MPISYGMPLWRSPRLRWDISQARPIVRKTKLAAAMAKPTTYQMPVIVLQQTYCLRRGLRRCPGREVQSDHRGGGFDARSLALEGESTRGAARRPSPRASLRAQSDAGATLLPGRVGVWRARRNRPQEGAPKYGEGSEGAGCGRLGGCRAARIYRPIRQWGSYWRLHTKESTLVERCVLGPDPAIAGRPPSRGPPAPALDCGPGH